MSAKAQTEKTKTDEPLEDGPAIARIVSEQSLPAKQQRRIELLGLAIQSRQGGLRPEDAIKTAATFESWVTQEDEEERD